MRRFRLRTASDQLARGDVGVLREQCGSTLGIGREPAASLPTPSVTRLP